MKPLLILIILSPLFQAATSDRIITCTVVEPDVMVSCPATVPLNDVPTMLVVISGWPAEKLDEWKWVVQYEENPVSGVIVRWNAPLLKESLKVGQKVKAIIGKDGELTPIASCAVRSYRAVNEYHQHGDRASVQLYGPPEDCQPGYEEKQP